MNMPLHDTPNRQTTYFPVGLGREVIKSKYVFKYYREGKLQGH